MIQVMKGDPHGLHLLIICMPDNMIGIIKNGGCMKLVVSKGMMGICLGIVAGLTVANAESADPRAGSVPSMQALLSAMDRSNESDNTPSMDASELFNRACSQCHDTSRSTSKTKTYGDWLVTVRRMASKTGANILPAEIEPIADYLSSLNPSEVPEESDQEVPTIAEVLAASDVTANATVSLLWRKGDRQVENEGFFPDVWAGAEWHPADNPFSIQVMACTTCHDDGSGGLNAELVEGSFRADLLHMMSGRSAAERDLGLEIEAKAGRLAVPFGAFSGMAHPGVYRTLTNPLMYNMGRRVGYYEPVLPMPYADEGVDLHFGKSLPLGFVVRLDGYAVNGLQEGGFTPSRSYRDNNSNAALGGRIVLGSSWLTLGGSYATGELQATGAPEAKYRLSGCDVVLRYLDHVRFYYEYARREEDTTPTLESDFSGHVAELEGRIWNRPRISLLVRYDSIDNSALYGGATIERFTWGPHVTLPGGSSILFNHEHWKHDDPLKSEDIIGIRWIVSL